MTLPTGTLTGLVAVQPPLRSPPSAPAPAPDLDLRLRVELARRSLPVACLRPWQPGLVVPIEACSELVLRLGLDAIGTATVEPTGDGRQQVTIVTINNGGRA